MLKNQRKFNMKLYKMAETEKDKLVQELNQLSENFEKNKERMVEIAKVLLTDHYWYLPKRNKECEKKN